MLGGDLLSIMRSEDLITTNKRILKKTKTISSLLQVHKPLSPNNPSSAPILLVPGFGVGSFLFRGYLKSHKKNNTLLFWMC